MGLTSLEASFDPLPNARLQEHRPIQQYESDFESVPPTPRTISVASIHDAVNENKASTSHLGNTVSTPFCAAPPPIQHTFEEPNYGLKRPKTPRSHGRVDMTPAATGLSSVSAVDFSISSRPTSAKTIDNGMSLESGQVSRVESEADVKGHFF